MRMMSDRMRAIRVGVCALIGIATAGTAAQVDRGPLPGGEPAPAPRPLQPASSEVREDGLIVDLNLDVADPIPGIPMTGIWEAGTTSDDPARVIPRPMMWDGPIIPLPEGYVSSEIMDESADAEPRFTPLFYAFDALGPNGLDPPDPDVAVGPNHIVEVTNDDFAIYDRDGTELFRRDINDFLGINEFLFDPKVIYDPWNNRWVMLWHERNFDTERGRLHLVISTTSTPWGLGSWYFYNFNVVQNAGTADASWPDYFDLGYQQDTVIASGNMFEFPDINGNRPFRWARHIVWDKALVYNQMSAGFLSFSNLTSQSGVQSFGARTCKGQWQVGDLDGVFLASRPGGGDFITIWRLVDAFGANTLTRVDVTVNPYTNPPNATQPNGGLLDTIDARLMPCVLTNDQFNGNGLEIFTALTTGSTGGEARARLYKFNASNNAVELDQDFFAGGWDYWFATPAADFSGNAYWVFCRTGNAPGREPELRFVDMNRGTFSNSSNQLRDGNGSRNPCFSNGNPSPCRWGDYFGASLDWGDYINNFSDPERPIKAWLVGEYGRPGTWGTAIGATSVYSQGVISGISPVFTEVIATEDEGEFTSANVVYAVTNNNQTGTRIAVGGLPAWLSSSVSEFDLYNGTRNVTISLNVAAANNLCEGTYTAEITFTDLFNGGSQFVRRVRLVVRGADLSVASVDAGDGTYFPGQTVSTLSVFQNDGDAGLDSFDYEVRLSLNTIISTSDILVLETSSFVGPNGSINSPRNWTIPIGTPPGTYFVGVRANTDPGPCDGIVTGFDAVPIQIVACPVDWNNSGTVDIFDILSFLTSWNAMQPAADYDGANGINIFDILSFLTDWNAGCP